MLVKTLSVRQPYAALICAGVKTVENRTWKTDYRGRLLIHASGDSYSMCDLDALPGYAIDEYLESVYNDSYEPPQDADEYTRGVFHIMDITLRHYGFEREFAKKLFEYKGRRHDDEKEIVEKVKAAVQERGFFFTSQAIIGECELADITQNSTSFFAESGQYHWIIKKPALYQKPVYNVMGRLRLWNYNLDA